MWSRVRAAACRGLQVGWALRQRCSAAGEGLCPLHARAAARRPVLAWHAILLLFACECGQLLGAGTAWPLGGADGESWRLLLRPSPSPRPLACRNPTACVRGPPSGRTRGERAFVCFQTLAQESGSPAADQHHRGLWNRERVGLRPGCALARGQGDHAQGLPDRCRSAVLASRSMLTSRFLVPAAPADRLLL